MKPTMELRFVEREVLSGLDGWRTVRILQQKWVEVRNTDVNWLTPPDFEWRDVPVEKEE